jgi:bacterioferritin (cytochrome b1)
MACALPQSLSKKWSFNFGGFMSSFPNSGFSPSFIPPAAIGAESDHTAAGAVCEQLNSLLRGEISAAETYKMAIDKISESDRSRANDCQCLRDMQEDHGRAAQRLRQRIRELGGEPSDSSGAWGVWAKTIEGTASLFGDNATLKALKEGEVHGLKDYKDAIDKVDATSASLIDAEFIPSQRQHIALLEVMMSSGKRA